MLNISSLRQYHGKTCVWILQCSQSQSYKKKFFSVLKRRLFVFSLFILPNNGILLWVIKTEPIVWLLRFKKKKITKKIKNIQVLLRLFLFLSRKQTKRILPKTFSFFSPTNSRRQQVDLTKLSGLSRNAFYGNYTYKQVEQKEKNRLFCDHVHYQSKEWTHLMHFFFCLYSFLHCR